MTRNMRWTSGMITVAVVLNLSADVSNAGGEIYSRHQRREKSSVFFYWNWGINKWYNCSLQKN